MYLRSISIIKKVYSLHRGSVASTDGGALVVPHHFEALAPFIREVVGAIGVFEPLERRVEVAQAAQQALLPEG